MYWFVSDTHYAHKNIVKGCSDWTNKEGCRPFESFNAHNDWLVSTINDSVMADDHLWFLGDWSFGGEHRVREFRDRIACRNIYVTSGNHDHHIKKFQETPDKYGFKWICDYAELNLESTKIVVCHYPLESWVDMERGAYHLHGHVHGRSRQLTGRYDVGVDALGPLSLDELRTLPKATTSHLGNTVPKGGNQFGSQMIPEN